MCGIWGFVGTSVSVSAEDAWRGLCSITNRGPDDWGLYFDEAGKITGEEGLPGGTHRVVLGNRRLSILDLSAAGNQPMSTDDGRYWIIYNGEVYNYRELREELRAAGYRFESDTDTEVLLQAYREFGTACVERFRGMYAFAIYDAIEDHVFAARDRFGIKPFYYDVSDERLAFASEVTALLDGNTTRPSLDLTSVDGFLALGYVPSPRTILDGVRVLPPGSILEYDAKSGEYEIESYWEPEFDTEEAGCAERLRELLRESVELRLRSDAPVGAFLSGGLDSSTIVALMREASEPTRGDLHTFSIGFDREEYTETRFAETVAQAFETDHTATTITAEDVRAELDEIVAAMDQPTIDGINTYFVSKIAADAGLKVALSGLGSDELLFGYPTFTTVPRRYRAADLVYAIPSGARTIVASGIEGLGGRIPGVPASKIADAIGSASPFGAAYMSVRGIFPRGWRSNLLEPRDPVDWTKAIEQEVEKSLSSDIRNAVSDVELSWYMHNQLLRDTDAMSMAHSLEVRVPFLDSELASYVLTVDPEAKIREEKGLLKKAMHDLLPEEVTEREKTGFTFPFADWLREDLHGVVEDALNADRIERTPLSSRAVVDIKRAFYRGDAHWSRLWALVVLSLWIDEHLQ